MNTPVHGDGSAALFPAAVAAPKRNPPVITATRENSRCCGDNPGTNAHPPLARHPRSASVASTTADVAFELVRGHDHRLSIRSRRPVQVVDRALVPGHDSDFPPRAALELGQLRGQRARALGGEDARVVEQRVVHDARLGSSLRARRRLVIFVVVLDVLDPDGGRVRVRRRGVVRRRGDDDLRGDLCARAARGRDAVFVRGERGGRGDERCRGEDGRDAMLMMSCRRRRVVASLGRRRRRRRRRRAAPRRGRGRRATSATRRGGRRERRTRRGEHGE
eukprot:31529-Pelagococcus_subviridis.AAC.2